MNNWIRSLTQFIKEAYSELRKVTWLSKKEAVGSTIVVIILVIIVAIFVSFADFILEKILRVLL